MTTLIEKAERLLNGISQTPWHIGHLNEFTDPQRSDIEAVDGSYVADEVLDCNLGFIIAAPQLVRELIERVKLLESVIKIADGDGQIIIIENARKAKEALNESN